MSYAPQTPAMTLAMSPEIFQSASAYQLGQQPDAVYRVRTGARRIIAGILLLVISLGLAAVGLGVISEEPTSSDNTTGGILLLLFGACLLAGAIYSLLYGTLHKHWCVYVFAYGFLYKKGNQAPQPFRWDQIEAVWYQVTRHYYNGVYTGTTHRYRVRRRDGHEVVLNNRFTQVGQLGESINNQVTKTLLPQVVAAYNAGQTITFGPLSVNRQGLTNILGKLLPWSEITGIDIQHGYVAVRQAGKWLKWSNQPVARIPNVFVFIALVKSLLPGS
ncbi:MAG TPA: DUF6585 family protein [Ktedonobacteraceae bacterium]